MFKQSKVIMQAINTLIVDVKIFVELNGGFINTSNSKGDCDYIYGYIVDWGADEVNEEVIYAIKVEDNELFIATCNKKWITIAESADCVPDDEWYVVGTCGDSVLTAQTILSIAESIEQYV